MTATRWWVRLFARWQARIDAVKGQIQAVSLAVTAFSTLSLLLRDAGYEEFVLPLGIALSVFGPGYAFVYFEGGVWNQVSRDRADMSGNWAGPGMRMNDEIIGRAVFAAIHSRPPDQQEAEAIEEAVDSKWSEFRDGLEAEELD